MKNKTENKKTKKKKHSSNFIPACEENSVIKDKNKLREDLGLTKKAKILME